MSSTLRLLIIAVLSLGQSAVCQVLEPRAPCTTACSLLGALQQMEWRQQKSGTVDSNGITHSIDKTKTGTVYIITVINTALDKTSIITSNADVWSGYTPPLTNTDGTLMQVHTYTFRGQTKTTTVTFPTPFFEWSASYGIQRFSGKDGDCIGANTTVEITSYPQPHGPYSVDMRDPFGWGSTLVTGLAGGRLFQTNVDLLPDPSSVPHKEIKTCKADGDTGPDFFARFQGSWKVVAVPQTVIEGGDGDGSNTPTASGRAGSVVTQKSTNVQTGTVSKTEGRATGSAAGPLASKSLAVRGVGVSNNLTFQLLIGVTVVFMLSR